MPDAKPQREQNKVFSEEIPVPSFPDTTARIHSILKYVVRVGFVMTRGHSTQVSTGQLSRSHSPTPHCIFVNERSHNTDGCQLWPKQRQKCAVSAGAGGVVRGMRAEVMIFSFLILLTNVLSMRLHKRNNTCTITFSTFHYLYVRDTASNSQCV